MPLHNFKALKDRQHFLKCAYFYAALCLDSCILLCFDQMAHHWRWIVGFVVLDVLVLLLAAVSTVVEKRRLLIPAIATRILLIAFMLLFTLFSLNAVYGPKDPLHYLEEYRKEIADHPIYIFIGALFSSILIAEIVLFLHHWKSITNRKSNDQNFMVHRYAAKALPTYFINLDEGCFSYEKNLRPENEIYRKQTLTNSHEAPVFVY